MKHTLENGRVVNIPDKDIANLQKVLDISFSEAVETWLVDNEYISDETVEELSKKAKENRITATVHQAKAENADKKARKPREKKENPTKKMIIQAIWHGLTENLDDSIEINVTNDEKYIDLTINGAKFTINLVQHREKKGS